jgi:glycine cleavage system H protein
MSTDQKNYKMIPEGESRCVWMGAGIVSYQLCDRSFDCDHCPLDAALRQHFSAAKDNPASAGVAAAAGRLPDDLRYTASHFWLRSLGPSFYRVGIEQSLANALLIPRAIILPDAGEQIRKATPFLWFVLENTTLPVQAMFDGLVLHRNDSLTDRPYKVYFHPFDQGWLFDIKVSSTPPIPFLNAADAQRLYATDQTLFRDQLMVTLQSESIGTTLADGGQMLQNVSSIIGPKRYYQLIGEIFLNKKAQKKRWPPM